MIKKAAVLSCFYLGIWGFIGFIITLLLGFFSCCLDLAPIVFYGALILYAIGAIAFTLYLVWPTKNRDFGC